MEELAHKNNLVALNTGMGTHLAPNGSSSAIDVALASPNKALKSTWKVLDQNLGSDHFVIQIVINEPAFQITLNKHEECKLEFFPTEMSQDTSPGSTVGRPRGEFELCHSEHSASCQTKFSCLKSIFGKTSCSLLERKLPTGI